jgi:hypothetical protein
MVRVVTKASIAQIKGLISRHLLFLVHQVVCAPAENR